MTRSKWKGLFIDHQLIKVLKKKIKPIKSDINKPDLPIYSRRSVIYPQFINKTVDIYNGHKFIKVKISNNMIGHKFGEFAATRQLNKFKKNKK